MRRVLAFLPLVAAIAATVYWLVVPAWTGVMTEAVPPGSPPGPSVVTRQTVLEASGGDALYYLLAMPALAGLVGWGAFAGRRWLAVLGTILLFGGVVLGLWSIGLFYLPAAGLALVVAVWPGRVSG